MVDETIDPGSMTPGVTMIVPYRFIPAEYGGQKAAYQTCLKLNQKLNFACISTRDNQTDQLPFPIYPIIGNHFSKYLNPWVAWRCIKTMRSMGSKRCIAFQPFMVPLLLLPLKLAGINLEIYIQNIEYARFRSIGRFWWGILYLVEFFAYRMASVLYFISKDDMGLAISMFSISPDKCHLVPYGTNIRRYADDGLFSSRRVRQRHGFAASEFLIIFFGLLSYQPNLKALDRIIAEIDPLLFKMATGKYRILICGRGLPRSYQELKISPTIEYLGHVEDISEYIKASDVVINPVTTGGGVKTKVIEAIALGKTVVSSLTGTLGVERTVCGEKLIVVGDNDYQEFCHAILSVQGKENIPTPDKFYQYYDCSKTTFPMVKNSSI